MALALAAFGVRLLGIGWGLPNALHNQSYHPDEYLLYVYSVGKLDLPRGAWDPEFYNYGSLWLYVLHLISIFLYGWGIAPEDSVAPIHLGCRVVTAALGAATAAIAYFIGCRVWRPAAGLTAALVLMIAPGHVVHSRFHTVDVPASFFVALSLLLAIKALQEQEWSRAVRMALWSFVVAGLAAAVKYNMAIVALSSALAVWMRHDRPGRTKVVVCVLGLLGAVIAFTLTTPGALFNTEKFLRDVSFEMRHVREGHGIVFAGTPSGWIYHFGNLMEALGTVVPLIAIAGLWFALKARKKEAFILLAFAIPYYALIASVQVKFLRYVLPLAVPICVLAGCTVAAGVRDSWRSSRGAAVAAFVLAFGAAAGNNVFVVTELMLQEDPRDRAAEWLFRNAVGSTIGFTTPPWFYSPPLFPETGAGFGVAGALYRLERMAEVERFTLVYYRPEDGSLPEWDPRLITGLRPEYVVFSSFEYEDAERIKLPGYLETMKLLRERYRPVGSFGFRGRMSHDMRYISPHIIIWKSKESSTH